MTTTSEHQSPTFDRMLDALGSRSRRQLLVHLLERNPRKEAKQVEELDFEDEPEQFLTRLRHVDLPKLAEMGYISWNRETGEIVKGPQFEEIRPLLELLVRHGDELPGDWL